MTVPAAYPAAVEVTSPAPRYLWQRLVDGSEDALVTQTPPWLDCICAIGHYEDASRLYEFHGDCRVVVPLVRRRGRLGRLIAQEAWPGEWGIGGPVSSRDLDLRRARAVFEDLARLPANRVSVRFGPGAAPAWLSAVPPGFTAVQHTTYVLDLAGGFGEVWQGRFKGRARTAVRKAEKARVEVEVDRTGRLVPAFYAIYEQSIVRWAQQQHEPLALARWRRRRIDPLRKFQVVAEHFTDSCAVWLASYRGQLAAALMVLRQGPHVKYWRGGMVKELAGPSCASTLLHKLVIEDACENGGLFYHMGDSTPGSSVSAFKESFGARDHTSFGYRRELLPVTVVDQRLRSAVKHLIGFKDE